MTLSNQATTVLQALRGAQEDIRTRAPYREGEWGSVYLDNALGAINRAQPGSMTRHAFAGYLSALHDAGLYDSQDDGFFGYVKMED